MGTPICNFSIPSALKARIDQLVRIGRTVGSARSGAQGLLE
jgi:FMN-dependent NADH-azoreductase